MASLDSEIERITSTLDDFTIISSIPGVGKQTASMILAEIGDIHNFGNARKIVAFAGIDPGVFSSGRFTASSSRISKRGSRHLRHAIFLAAQCSIRGNINPTLRSFYEKKRTEGKPYKVAIMASANKLLNLIFSMLTKQEHFQVDH